MGISKLGKAALKYAELGFYVLPLGPASKRPITRFGHKDASKFAPRIHGWWQDEPGCNVGIACAASGILVLDIDNRPAAKDRAPTYGWETLGRLEKDQKLPVTARVKTPGNGEHIYLRVPPWAQDKRLKGSIGDPVSGGIQVKHQGYVVAPPSLHPCGRDYAWDSGAHLLETPIAEAPGWLLTGLFDAPPKHIAGSYAFPSKLEEKFAGLGWLGVPLSGGRTGVRCPWAHEHTDGRGFGQDSSTVIFDARSEGGDGAFFCSHAHCQGKSFLDVVRELRLRNE